MSAGADKKKAKIAAEAISLKTVQSLAGESETYSDLSDPDKEATKKDLRILELNIQKEMATMQSNLQKEMATMQNNLQKEMATMQNNLRKKWQWQQLKRNGRHYQVGLCDNCGQLDYYSFIYVCNVSTSFVIENFLRGGKNFL